VTGYRFGGNYKFEGTNGKEKGRKTWSECMKVDMKSFFLVKEDAHNRDK